MDDAAIRRFIDSLDSPEAFSGPSTAIAERTPQLLSAAGRDLLEWQAVALEALTLHLLGGPALPLAAALVQSDGTCRVADQECCEELGWFVDRLRRELAGVPRPWVAVMAPDATEQGVAFASYEVLNRPPRLPVRRLAYYIETRSPAVSSAMAGSVMLNAPHAEVVCPEPVLPAEAGLLGRVLRGHPDRRRHRLPRLR